MMSDLERILKSVSLATYILTRSLALITNIGQVVLLYLFSWPFLEGPLTIVLFRMWGCDADAEGADSCDGHS